MRSNLVGWLARAAGIGALMMCGAGAEARTLDAHLRPDQTTGDIPALTARARAGDKQAQLDLGIRYEQGQTVPRSAARARHWYRLAAADSGGPVLVYQAPIRRGDSGRLVQLGSRPVTPGLPDAKARLARLTAAARD